MKNFLHRFLLIILMAFMVTGCATSKFTKMQNYSKEEFLKGQKAVVFFDVGGINTNGNFQSFSYVLGKYKDYNKHGKPILYNLEYPKKISSLSLVAAFAGQIYYEPYNRSCYGNMLFLDPGIYYIDEITLYTTADGYSRRFPSISSRIGKVFTYGAFKVNAGEVLNLGRLVAEDMSLNYDEFNHKYEDLDYIKSQLTNHNQSFLSNKVKQGEFFMPGSIIHKDKSGNDRIIQSFKIEKYIRKTLDRNIDEIDSIESD